MSTCQICGRPIKTVHGIIADHGYRQPWLKFGSGDGSRTAKCDGSRQLPYEVSRDAIPPATKWRREQLTTVRAQQEKLISDPPATLRYAPTDAYGRPRCAAADLPRPEGFDPAGRHYTGRPATYEFQFDNRVRSLGQTARLIEEAISALDQRYREWRAAA